MLLPKLLRGTTSDQVDACPPSRPHTAGKAQPRTWTTDRIVPLPGTVTRTSNVKYGLPPPKTYEAFSKYSIEIPHLIPTPWESDRQKRHFTFSRAPTNLTKQFPARIFLNLPREIYDCILAWIEEIHLNRDRACPSCYLKDMTSLALVSRAWDRAATAQLYRAVMLPTHDGWRDEQDSNGPGLSRLKKIRRTLREHPTLARYVRELHFADMYALYEQAGTEREGIINVIASLVMAAPNLERLVGFHGPLTKSFDRLSYALSTRRNLKEQVWLLDEGNGISEEEIEAARGPHYHEAYDPTERFLTLNSNHDTLSSLIIHQNAGQESSDLNFRAIIGTLQSNPHVRHLALSGLPTSAFTNLTLNALPVGLLSLRLEGLAGINDRGLLRFFTSPRASCLRKLSLLNISLQSLATISAIFCDDMSDLESFTISQDQAPTLTSHSTVPDFHGPKLKYMHWEFRSEAGPPPALPSSSEPKASEQLCFPFKTSEPISCLATTLLATSIRNGAFPSLRKVRIPHDPQGLIQNLCKPLAAALTPYEVASLTPSSRISRANGFSIEVQNLPYASKLERYLVTTNPSSSTLTDSLTGSSSTASGLSQHVLSPLRSRVAAHCRIMAARKEEVMAIKIVGPDGEICASNVVGGYMGDITSQINYVLEPDRSRTIKTGESASEWLTEVHDLVGDVQTHDVRRAICRHAVGSTVGRKAISVVDLF